MAKEATKIKSLSQEIIHYIRVNHSDVVDKAYAYFWDNENPDEFMGGTALSLGFHNFEDWMVFDYKVNEEGETFVDLFIKDRKDLPEDSVDLLQRTVGGEELHDRSSCGTGVTLWPHMPGGPGACTAGQA